MDTYPYNYHKNLKKIGILPINKNEYLFLKNKDAYFINNFNDTMSYLKDLLIIMHLNNFKHNVKKIFKNTINIITDDSLSMIDLNVDSNKKKMMFNIGKKSFNNFFKKIYLKRRKKYLIVKYYFLWKNKLLLK